MLGSKVLLVDDDPMILLTLSALANRYGIAHELAQNGEKAVAMADEIPYLCIFMDIQMPVLDGFGAAGKIRSQELAMNKKPVPIFALTSAAQDGFMHARAEAAGMSGWIQKPLTYRAFRVLMDDLLDRSPGSRLRRLASALSLLPSK